LSYYFFQDFSRLGVKRKMGCTIVAQPIFMNFNFLF
jgi:hypothetical protein